MALELANAPAYFQRALDMILPTYTWKTCLLNLEDLTIFSRNLGDHLEHVDEILSNLVYAGVTLKIDNCHVCERKVEYVGFMIKTRNLETVKTNLESLRQAQSPTKTVQRRSFLWLCNAYRRSFDNFSIIAHPLNKVLKKGTPNSFQHGHEHREVFDTFIDISRSPTSIALPRDEILYSIV